MFVNIPLVILVWSLDDPGLQRVSHDTMQLTDGAPWSTRHDNSQPHTEYTPDGPSIIEEEIGENN